jgi:hypothetical protein
VVLGFCFWVRRKNKKRQKGKQETGPRVQQLGEAPPVNQSSYGGSGESFPGTAGHEPPHSFGQSPVPQSVGYSRTSRTSSMYQTSPGVPPGMSGQNARPSSEDPLREGPLLVQPSVAVSPSTRPARRLSATPIQIRVEQTQNSATSPSQHTRTLASSNSGPIIQHQPDVVAPRPQSQRAQSIHDPRFYTAADFYSISSLSQGHFYRDGS